MKYILVSLMFIFVPLSSFAEPSLFGYQKVWRDQNGTDKRLVDFSDGPFLISMVYTSCPHTCPMTISKIEKIKTLLEKSGIRKLRVVLASFDEKVDTPESLKKFVLKRKLNEEEWTFLSPDSQKEARELSVLLGISYKKLGEGDFSHSNVISLVSTKGLVLAKINHLSADIRVFADALKTELGK